MENESHSRVSILPALPLTDAAGASSVGAIIDTKGFESIVIAIMSGTITTGSFTVQMHDGDNSGLSDAAVVANAELPGRDPAQAVGIACAFAVTDDDDTYRFGYVGKKRYLRLTLLGASTPVGEFAAIAVLGHPKNAPVADVNGA